MHKSSMLRMKWFADNYVAKLNGNKIKILDVGSYSVNGSYKEIFNDEKFEYIGLDMEMGPNVDLVMKNPYDWSELKTDDFDIIISGQAFEHIEFFWIIMSEMTRVLKKDGLMCIIVPNREVEHRYPVDCYRFYSDGMVALARYFCLETLHSHTNCAPPLEYADWYSEIRADSMLIAKKPYSGKSQFVNLQTYACIPSNQEILRTGMMQKSSVNKFTFYYMKIKLKNLSRMLSHINFIRKQIV